jgi:hypothetical protein
VNREIRCSHVAITVPALEEAEAYYRTLFDMEVVTREAAEGRQLPRDKSWKDAHASGIDLYMVALRRGEFVLALFNEGPVCLARQCLLGCRCLQTTSPLSALVAMTAKRGSATSFAIGMGSAGSSGRESSGAVAI